MSKPLYYDDAYLKTFESRIANVKQDEQNSELMVALEETAFYPGGGGQPADTGWLNFERNRVDVTKTKRSEGLIWHHLSSNIAFDSITSGALISGELDWTRRYQIMRTHTAMHILCGVVWHDYGASVTGGNMGPGSGRMDFEFERMSKDLVQDIEKRCNEEVAAKREIVTDILPREEALQIPDLIRTKVNLIPSSVKQIRTVEIVGLDLQADGGTHVKNTEEVGTIKIIDYKSKGAINKRIYLDILE